MCLLCFFLTICLGAQFVLSNSSSAEINSDLVILTNNDLSNVRSSDSIAAILLGTPAVFNKAAASCELLGESLWTPGNENSHPELNASLAYQAYQDSYPSTQLFWISQNISSSCRAIDFSGQSWEVNCEEQFPALCTQTAPISNSTFNDTSDAFQFTLQTENQTLTGYRDIYSWKFLGVRFGAPPERFTYSTVYSGSGHATALEPGPACIQPSNIGSEDCLFLNIWTPFLPSSKGNSKIKLKAVMLWIFGGGFIEGTGFSSATDGTNLASRGDVVVLSANFRLGNIGFLALDDGVTNGNYGIQDMITALEWISKNIQSFGGDPSRVTVFGQSSGAAAVRALLASPKAKGLISAAIMESNPAGFSAFGPYSNYSIIQQEFQRVGISVLNQTGCLNVDNRLACLRSVDAYSLANLPVFYGYPLIDGTYLVSNGLSPASNRFSSEVALLTGTNRDEGANTAPYPPQGNITQAFVDLGNLLSLNLSYIPTTGLFPIPNNPNTTIEIFNVTSRVVTNGGLHCLDQATAYSASKHGSFSSIYSYRFNRTYLTPDTAREVCIPPITMKRPFGDPDMEYFKCHAGEVAYVFGSISRLGLPDRDGFDIPFSQLVVDHWSAFARTRNPNPDMSYLTARGYRNTISHVEESGRWNTVNASKPMAKLLQWNGAQVEFGDIEQCNALELPLDYFEKI